MCKECGDFNYFKVFSTDLSGQTALITGARLKIGYQATLKMLRREPESLRQQDFLLMLQYDLQKRKTLSNGKQTSHIWSLICGTSPVWKYFGDISKINMVVSWTCCSTMLPRPSEDHPGFFSAFDGHRKIGILMIFHQRSSWYFKDYRELTNTLLGHEVNSDHHSVQRLSWDHQQTGMGITSSALYHRFLMHWKTVMRTKKAFFHQVILT